MITRIITRCFTSLPLRFTGLKVMSRNNNIGFAISSSYMCNNNPHAYILRLYSQQVTPEMIANYDYVKKATSKKDVLIVDVREPEEIKEHGQIPNSINIPLGNVTSTLGAMPNDEFEKMYKRAKPKDETEIIFYCMIGKRSGMAQQNAMNLGYKNSKNYLGSWTDWAAKSQ